MNYNCKHIVAVLLFSLERAGTASGSSLPAKAEEWLRQCEAALAHSLMQSGKVPLRNPAYRLAYALIPDRRDGSPRLHLCKARLRKDGGIGGATLVTDFYSLLTSRPAYAGHDDEEPIRLLAALRAILGLGKTIQTLAHILVEKETGRLDAPALVVAPASLMSNWQAEAARFAPGLRVLLHGKERTALFERIGGADLVLTTGKRPVATRLEATGQLLHHCVFSDVE